MVKDCLISGFGVTKSWVEETMATRFSKNVKVSNVEVLSVCGYMSAITRVHLDWKSDDEKLPKTVIAKIPSGAAAEEAWKKSGGDVPEQDENSADPIHEHMHNMEILVYGFFRKSPAAGLKTPTFYGSLPMSSTPVLLIEDICDSYTVDLVDGFSEKHLYQIVDQLVALHKWSDKNNSLWREKTKFEMDTDPDSSQFGGMVMGMMMQMSMESSELAEAVNLVKNNYAGKLTWMKDMMDKAAASPKSVFGHGDLWAPQILWRDDKIASIVDWALCRAVFPTEDLIRVLTTCCTVEQRRKLADPLLQYYVDHMDGKVTFEEIKQDFIDMLPYSCCNMTFALAMWSNSPVLRRGKDDDEERLSEMRRRYICTVQDTADACGWKK